MFRLLLNLSLDLEHARSDLEPLDEVVLEGLVLVHHLEPCF